MEDTKKNAGMIIILGVLTVIAGFLSLVMPWVSGVGLAFVVGFAMVIGGVARLVGVFQAGSFGRGTLAFVSAAMGFLLGILLLKEWPLSGLWAIGTLVGINMLFAGFAMISIASAARKVVKAIE